MAVQFNFMCTQLAQFLDIVDTAPESRVHFQNLINEQFRNLNNPDVPIELQLQVVELRIRWDRMQAEPVHHGAAPAVAHLGERLLGAGPAEPIEVAPAAAQIDDVDLGAGPADHIQAYLDAPENRWMDQGPFQDSIIGPDPRAFLQVLRSEGLEGPRAILCSRTQQGQFLRYFGKVSFRHYDLSMNFWITFHDDHHWYLSIHPTGDDPERFNSLAELQRRLGTLVTREEAEAVRAQVEVEYGINCMRRPQGLPEDLQNVLVRFEEEIRATKAQRLPVIEYYRAVLEIYTNFINPLNDDVLEGRSAPEVIIPLTTYFSEAVTSILPSRANLAADTWRRVHQDGEPRQAVLAALITTLDEMVRIGEDTPTRGVQQMKQEWERILAGLQRDGLYFLGLA